MKVITESYNPQWAVKFLEIQETLQKILRDVAIDSIEHVGSTSIPGLRAKPVIDIDIIIRQSSLKAADAAMVEAGYTSLGELDIPGRYVFREPGYGKLDAAHGPREDGEPRQNTYVCIRGCESLRNHLDVKRILLQDEQLREEYGQVKAGMADTDFEHIDQYVARKTEILCKILRAAGWDEERVAPIMDINK